MLPFQARTRGVAAKWFFGVMVLVACQHGVATEDGAKTPLAIDGIWRFVDDGTVIEMSACGTAICGVVRVPPPPSKDPKDIPPKCGQTVIEGFKQSANRKEWTGKAIDPADNKQYAAKLRAAKNERLELVVSVLGGLVQESMQLEPVKSAINFCTPNQIAPRVDVK
jgi:uncharacterized protein (DUF2147 family)